MQESSGVRFEAMTFGMVLDQALRLYAANFPLLLGIITLAYTPYYFLFVILALSGRSGPDSIDPANLAALGISSILLLLLMIVLVPLSTGATAFAVSEKYLGRPVTILSAYRAAIGRLLSILGSQFVVGIAVWLGVLACLAPGIYLWVSWALVVPAIVLEKQAAFDGMRRSWDLTEGFRWKVFGVAAVIAVLSFALLFGAIILATMLLIFLGDAESPRSQIITQTITTAASLVTTPLYSVVVVLLYYDLRIRKEGFDLVLLHQSLHGGKPDLSYKPPTSTLGLT